MALKPSQRERLINVIFVALCLCMYVFNSIIRSSHANGYVFSQNSYNAISPLNINAHGGVVGSFVGVQK